MEEKFIPLSVPNFAGHEKEYVNDAVVSEWVSTGGSLVGNFEEKFAAYVGMPPTVRTTAATPVGALWRCWVRFWAATLPKNQRHFTTRRAVPGVTNTSMAGVSRHPHGL